MTDFRKTICCSEYKIHVLFFILILSFSINQSLMGQSELVKYSAHGKHHGDIINISEYTLRFTIWNQEKTLKTNESIQIKNKYIGSNESLGIRYDSLDFITKEKDLKATILYDLKRLINATIFAEILVKFGEITLNRYDPDLKNAYDFYNEINKIINQIDENPLVAWMTINQKEALMYSLNRYQKNIKYYEYYKETKYSTNPIIHNIKRSSTFYSVNPNFNFDGGWYLSKSALNEDWTRKGWLSSFSLNLMISISPEICFGRNLNSKFYFHTMYDRISFLLNPESQYYLGESYFSDINSAQTTLPTNDKVDLAIRQFGSGITFATIVHKVRFDIGGGFNLLERSFIKFDEETDYKIPLKASKIQNDVKSDFDLFETPYFNFGISYPFGRPNQNPWVNRNLLGVRLSGTYQKLNLTSQNGIDMYLLEEDFETIDISTNLPRNLDLFSVKLTFLIYM